MHKHGGARTRGLAAELKELRARSGMTTREVAKRTGFSIAMVNRMENGLRRITPEDAASVLAVYGVTGAARARILDLARNADQPGWWADESGEMPHSLATFISLEAEATEITHVSMLRLPGLLQTADYIRTTMRVLQLPETRAKAMVAARLRRQQILTKRHAPHYLAIIDEVAFRRHGSDELMGDQVRHLLHMAERPNVDIRIIPFEHGTHAGLDGSYVHMAFAKAGSIVYLEMMRSALFLDKEHEVRPYQVTTDTLLTVAQSSADSVKFLRRLASKYGRE